MENIKWVAKWIKPKETMNDVCPEFEKKFYASDKEYNSRGKVISAKLYITALGAYEAHLNGKRIGEYILAPGRTSHKHGLQYREYDITSMLKETNLLSVTVGKDRCRSSVPGRDDCPTGMIVQLEMLYEDGSSSRIVSDESWTVKESRVMCSEIHHRETFDESFSDDKKYGVAVFDGPADTLIPQEDEMTKEQEKDKT